METKVSKRLLSAFLALVMLCSIIPTGIITASAANYKVSATVQYANSHWNDGVGLCAEFVSRCLSAGGISIPNKAYYSSNTQSYKNNSGTLDAYTNPYTCSASLLLYLSENYTIITNPSSSDIELGDVVFMYGGSNSQWRDGHVGIVTSISNGKPVYSAHNRATNSGTFSSSYPCTYVAKMKGVAKEYYVDVWASEKGQGYQYNQCSAVSSGIAGNSYYVWFKMAEKTTGALYNENTNWSSKISVYYPDGTLLHSCSYSKDSADWIRITPDVIGTYKLRIQITGDITADYSKNFTVTSGAKITWDKSNLNLNLSSHKTDTIQATLSGVYPSGASGKESYDSNIISISRDGNIYTITAKKVGTTNFSFLVYDKNGNLIASTTCKISVTQNTYTVKYDANGGVGAPAAQTKIEDNDLILSSVIPNKTGYIFDGWASSANGAGFQFSPGGKYNLNNNMTLYAQYNPIKYNVEYNAHDGTGTMADSVYTYDTAKALTANTFTRAGYEFIGWSTSPTATTATYTNGQSVKNLTSTNGGTITLYAVWKPNEYYIYYNSNGGTGTMANSYHYYDTVESLSANKFTKDGYTFLGWSRNSTAITPTYTDGQTVKNLISTTGGVTLYAVWQKNPVTATSISVQNMPTKTIYEINDTFSASGISIKVTYSDGTSKIVTSGLTVSKPDMTTAGTKTVTILYEGKTTSFNITVNEKNIDENSPILNVESVKAVCGQQVNIPLKTENAELGTFTADIFYDSTKLKLISIDGIPFDMFETNTNTLGKIRLVCIDSQSVSAGVIANLKFEVITNIACTTTVSISVEEAYDEKDVPVDLVVHNGEIQIVKTVPGDVNGDGKVTAIDARWILQYTAGNKTLTDEQKASADVNNDGKITAIDARAILRQTAGN